MIQAGMVYKATPPLFSIKANGKNKFFIDNMEMIKYNQKAFSQKYQIKNSKKEVLSSKDLTIFLYKNMDYLYTLESVSKNYGIETILLEDIITNYVENGNSINFGKFQKYIRSKYRFMDVVKDKSGMLYVEGTITKSNSVPLSIKFFNDCKDFIKIVQSNDYLHYYVDNTPASIYDIMRLYENNQPSSVHRYKGLGETDPKILEQAVMDASADRILIQYTMDDIKETMETIREYESDKRRILSLVGNITRDDLVE